MIYYTSDSQTKARIATLISNKINFKAKFISGNKDNFVIIKLLSINLENTIVHLYPSMSPKQKKRETERITRTHLKSCQLDFNNYLSNRETYTKNKKITTKDTEDLKND